MLWSSVHPLKHDMNVSTELHPLNTSAGIDLIFVPENVCWKFSHFELLAKRSGRYLGQACVGERHSESLAIFLVTEDSCRNCRKSFIVGEYCIQRGDLRVVGEQILIYGFQFGHA